VKGLRGYSGAAGPKGIQSSSHGIPGFDGLKGRKRLPGHQGSWGCTVYKEQLVRQVYLATETTILSLMELILVWYGVLYVHENK